MNLGRCQVNETQKYLNKQINSISIDTGRTKLGVPLFFKAFARIFRFGKKLLVYVVFLRKKYLYEKKSSGIEKQAFIFFSFVILALWRLVDARRETHPLSVFF